jgi:hypothetical protein
MKQYYLVSLVKECGAGFGDDWGKKKNNAKVFGSSVLHIGVEKSDAHTVKL